MDIREEVDEVQVGQRGAWSLGKDFHFQSLAWKQQDQWTSKTLEDMDNGCLNSMKGKVHGREFLRLQRPLDRWEWKAEVEKMGWKRL